MPLQIALATMHHNKFESIDSGTKAKRADVAGIRFEWVRIHCTRRRAIWVYGYVQNSHSAVSSLKSLLFVKDEQKISAYALLIAHYDTITVGLTIDPCCSLRKGKEDWTFAAIENYISTPSSNEQWKMYSFQWPDKHANCLTMSKVWQLSRRLFQVTSSE